MVYAKKFGLNMNNKFFYLGNNSYNYDWVYLFNKYKEIVCQKDHVLEIGSSNTRKSKQLASCCRRLVGVEKYKEFIPKNGEVKIINLDWANLDKVFKKNQFDIVVASHVIEHVEDDLKCLNQTFDVLKPGGYFLFITPNRQRTFERLRSFFIGNRKFPYHEHLREYSEQNLKRLLLKSKFCRSKSEINGVVFGIHAGPLYLFLKEAPGFLRQWTNFWEVAIKKV